MKRLHAVLLLFSLLFCCFLLPACDNTPADVVIGSDEIHPNEDHKPTTPPGEEGGEGNTGGENGGETPPEEDEPSGGIGNNEAVDLPFVPV